MTKEQKEKLNKMFDNRVHRIALDHSDYTYHAEDHWKDYLNENYKDPAEWAELNLRPDEIKDILKGKGLSGLD